MLKSKLLKVSFSVLLVSATFSYGKTLSKYSIMSKREILLEIFSEVTEPQASDFYRDEAVDLKNENIDWQNIAEFHSFCVLAEVNAKAMRQDLIIFHYIHVKNKGRESKASDKITKLVGLKERKHAVDIYSGAEFDCSFETLRHINDLKEKDN